MKKENKTRLYRIYVSDINTGQTLRAETEQEAIESAESYREVFPEWIGQTRFNGHITAEPNETALQNELYEEKRKNQELAAENQRLAEEKEKREAIAQREKYRALLQIDNLIRTAKALKDEIDEGRGLGLHLPAVETQMDKVSSTCRKLQRINFKEDWKPGETDQEKSLQQIEEETEEIQNEIGDPWPGATEEAESLAREEEIKDFNYPDQEQHKEYGIDRETEEIEAIEKEIRGEKDTKVF